MVTVLDSDTELRQRAWDAAASVVDPEIPVLTIADLGVLRDVILDGDRVEVAITPTYSGCPAMNMIALEIEVALERVGFCLPPQCGSNNTELLSEFGSTSCKALWRCKACREPFDYFKCH